MTAEEFIAAEFSASGYGKPILPGSFLKSDGELEYLEEIRKARVVLSDAEFARLQVLWIEMGGTWPSSLSASRKMEQSVKNVKWPAIKRSKADQKESTMRPLPSVTLEALAEEFAQLKRSRELLEKVWSEVGPYGRGQPSGDTWQKIRDHFGFDDSE